LSFHPNCRCPSDPIPATAGIYIQYSVGINSNRCSCFK
jgi:hypothetical protein